MHRVLYVDDEQMLLEIAKIYLEKDRGYSVDTALSARDVLQQGNLRDYDAIISDYQMPEMDGIAFLKEVRSQSIDTPFILFTGRGREEIVIQALNEGADFYLQKGGEPKSQFAELSHKVHIAIEHHCSVQKLKSLNRLYSVLSATNRAMVHIRTKSEFFSEICRILVEMGGFRMAWIGTADREHAKILPVASAGHIDGYLDTLSISTEDVPNGRGPTGTAYREGKFVVSNDITLDPRLEPWRENSLKRGYKANAAFPFALGTKNAGVISLYAPVTGFYDDQIVCLLAELAGDVSFALKTMDDEEDRRSAQEAQHESEERFAAFMDHLPVTAFIKDEHSVNLYVNRHMEEVFGAGDWIGKNVYGQFPADAAKKMVDDDQEVIRQGFGHAIEHLSDKNGTKRIFETYKFRIDRRSKPPLIGGFAIDITARTEAQDHLRESEEKYRSTLDTFPDAISVTARDFRIILANTSLHAWMCSLGFRGDIVGKPLLEAFPFLPPSVLDEYQQVFDTGKILVTEESTGIGDMEVITETRKIPLREHNEIVAVAAIIRDVTEHRHLEEQYRTLVTHIQDGAFLSQDGAMVFCNDALAAMLGYAADEISGCPIQGLIAPEDRATVMERHMNRLGGKTLNETYELTMLHRDGTTRVPVRISVGTGIYKNKPAVIGTIHDMTREYAQKAALQESELRARAIFDSTFQYTGLVTTDGILIEANSTALNFIGMRLEDLRNRPFWETGWWSGNEERVRRLQEAVKEASSGKFVRYEVELQGVDTTTIHVDFSLKPVSDSKGRVSLLIAEARDISERKRVEEALRLTNRRLNLLSGINRHDLRNQVFALKANLDLCMMYRFDPVKILECTNREKQVLATIERQIEFTSEYEGLGMKQSSWQNIGASIRSVLNRPHIKEKAWISPELDATEILTDPLMKKVFFNLIDNAERYGGGDMTSVRFLSEKYGDDLLVVCEDDGMGIARDEKDKIFERGFGRNTGYGLFLIREILAITGITIRETGEPGKGARFEMIVPKGSFRIV
jgi:PAS domain S-box-containing protein